MLRFGVPLFLLMVGVLFCKELPEVSKLGDLDYEIRLRAQDEFTTWIIENEEVAKDVILAQYLGTDHPEIKTRLVGLLERAYFPAAGYVGILMQPVGTDALGRRKGGDSEVGVTITQVVFGTPAADCGLMVGDVLVEVGDWKVGSEDDVISKVALQIQGHRPGKTVRLGIRRKGE